MKIYVSHSRNYDYKNELYVPLRESELNKENEIILPHENSDEPYPSRDLLLNKNCDLMIAEVSQAATGQEIEIGWANASGISVICIYKQGSKVSGSLKVISNHLIEYTDTNDMVNKLQNALNELNANN